MQWDPTYPAPPVTKVVYHEKKKKNTEENEVCALPEF
jgi:hypothetical protein